MRTILVALGAISLAIPTVAIPTASAKAGVAPTTAVATFDQRRKRDTRYREWRGRDGRTYCRRSDGTTGVIVGAVGGALVGRAIDTRGDRAGGTIIGAIAGGLAGREIERSESRRRCR